MLRLLLTATLLLQGLPAPDEPSPPVSSRGGGGGTGSQDGGVPGAQEGRPEPGPCHVDVACAAGDPWRAVEGAVVRITSRHGKCTGVLLNNVARDGTPYVLTAEHCGDLANATFTFHYRRPACGEGEPGADAPAVTGSTEVVVDPRFDVRLVRLRAMPPAGADVLYAGWDRSDAQPTGVATLHHPRGAPMKVSVEEDPLRREKGYWRVVDWELGATEKGSSGAPLFDREGRVIGHLTGGDRQGCEEAGADLFVRLQRAAAVIGSYLDPEGSGALTLDALDPAEAAEALAFRVDGLTEDAAPAAGARIVVRGMGFSGQTGADLDGEPVAARDVTWLANSRLAVTLPEELAPGEHELVLVDFLRGDRGSLRFRVDGP